MTRRQREVVLLLQDLRDAGRPMPSSREIAAGLEIRGVGRVFQILCTLRRDGWLDWDYRDRAFAGLRLKGRLPVPNPTEGHYEQPV